MSTRSRNRSNPKAVRPPLVGRLHELATTRRVSTRVDPGVWWEQQRLAGECLIHKPQAAVFGALGRGQSFRRPGRGGKTALMRMLYLAAMRRSDRPVVVLDEAAAVEPFDFSSVTDVVIDPLRFGPLRSASSNRSGEW
jgi:hypothetical protein